MRSPLVYLVALLAVSAFAQSADDWSAFPSSNTVTPPQSAEPKPAGKPNEPAKPADPKAKQKPATTPPAAASTAGETATANVPAAEAPEVSESASDEPVIVSTEERFIPNQDLNSRSTLGNAYNASGNLRIAPGVLGIGLLHTGSAHLGKRGMLRLGATGEFMSTGHFPEAEATNTRGAGTFALSFVALEWLEAYVSYAVSSNTNSGSSPRLLQALGDLKAGAKASRQVATGTYVGADLTLMSYSAVGGQGMDRGAFGLAPRLLATFDVSEHNYRVPLRVHANLGAILDGTGSLAGGRVLTAAEEYALGINRYHRLTGRLGFEAPLPAVTPFLEYGFELPLGVEGGELLTPEGASVPVFAAMPQTLGLGARLTVVRDLTITAAVDMGLSSAVGLGVPATAPFNFFLALAFNVDPFQESGTRLVETVRERTQQVVKAEPVTTGKVIGTIVDASTKKAVPGVLVTVSGTGLPPVATDAEFGHFATQDLSSGPLKVIARKAGYKELSQELVLEAGQTAMLELTLEPEASAPPPKPVGPVFELRVTNNNKPIAASVDIQGPVKQSVSTEAGAKDPLRVEVQAGHYILNVTAEGFLSQTREVQISDGASMPIAFELVPQPKKKLVVVKDDRIEILQQVHFATAKATILADSFTLLKEVVDAVVKNNIKRLRIEGHTDNKGGKDKNKKLSQDRAKAVADFLVAQGIDRARLETAGHGDAKPVAPNLTARGRELNRRVEFLIVER